MKVSVNGNKTEALLDSGSTVSTVSESYNRNYLADTCKLMPITDILNVECANGQLLQYLGYIEASLTVPGLSGQAQCCLFLIVPDSGYNSAVPLFLGTNVLSPLMHTCRDRHGARFLQQADLHAPWYLTFRCLSLRERDLSRNDNRLGIVRCAETRNIVMHPNSYVAVKGYVDKGIVYHHTCALLQPSKLATISSLLDPTPGMVEWIQGKKLLYSFPM